jgi:hypothetical protein
MKEVNLVMFNWVAIGNVLRFALPVITAVVTLANDHESKRAQKEMLKEVLNEVLDERKL